MKQNYLSHFRLDTNLSFLVELAVHAVDESNTDLEIFWGKGPNFERKDMW